MKTITRYLLPALLLVAVVGVAVGLAPGAWQGNFSGLFFRGDSSDVPRAVAPSDPLPAEGRDYAGKPRHYDATLATNSVTWLSSICSYTVPCEVVFESGTDYHWGDATTTVATVQKSASLITGGSSSRWAIAPYSADPSLFDMGFTGTTATAAEFRVTVVPRTMP